MFHGLCGNEDLFATMVQLWEDILALIAASLSSHCTCSFIQRVNGVALGRITEEDKKHRLLDDHTQSLIEAST